MASRLSQQVLELLSTQAPPGTGTRVTQHGLEVLGQSTAQTHVTQHGLEVLSIQLPETQTRVTQHALEVLSTGVTSTRVTQHALEGLSTRLPDVITSARVTQHLLEVLSTDQPVLLPVPLPLDAWPVRLHTRLETEILGLGERLLFQAAHDLGAGAGGLREVRVPDGTVALALVPAHLPRLSALLVTSDNAVGVTIGAVAQNSPILLASAGLLAVFDAALVAAEGCHVTYTPGDGSVATCLVLVIFAGD